MAHIIQALAEVINIALELYKWLIIAQAILSWVSPDPYNPIVRFLYSVTEPVLSRVRRLIPTVIGGVDLAPLLVIFTIIFLQHALVPNLRDLAHTLG